MADMNTSKITTLIVIIVIGTILITGVVVPVITNSTTGTGGEYTNTGQFQMMILSEENYAESDVITIRGVPTDDLSGKLIFSENDVVFTEYEYDAENLSEIPLMIGMWTESNSACYIYMNAGIYENAIEWDAVATDFSDNNIYTDSSILGSNFTLTITSVGGNYGYEITYTNDQYEDEWFTTLGGIYARIAPVGELIYSQTPHIDEDSLIFAHDKFDPGNTSPEENCKIGYIKTKDNLNGTYYTGSYFPVSASYYPPQTVDVTLDVDNGVLNGIDTVWTWAEGVTTEHTISGGYIVTKTISSGGSADPTPVTMLLYVIPLLMAVGLVILTIRFVLRKE